MSDEIVIHEMSSDETAMLLRQKAEIDIQISTAHAFPRNVKQCVEDIVFMATIDVETAMTCGYSVPRAGKAITGPSVHLAKIIMQNWGNFRADARVVNVTDKYVESEAMAWDLQKNVAVKVAVKRSIQTKTGKMSEDMIIVTGNAANSIAIRNAIFSVVPKGITDKAYEAAQTKIIGEASEFSGRVKKVLQGFKKVYGKEESEVLILVGKTKIDQLTPDNLVTLIGIGQALKDGDTTPELVWTKTPEEKKQDLREKQADKTPTGDAPKTDSAGQSTMEMP